MSTEQDPNILKLILPGPLDPVQLARALAALAQVGISTTTDYKPVEEYTETGFRKHWLTPHRLPSGDQVYLVTAESMRAYLRFGHGWQTEITQKERVAVERVFESLTHHMQDYHQEGNEHPQQDECPLIGVIERHSKTKKGWGPVPDYKLLLDPGSLVTALDRGMLERLPLHRSSEHSLGGAPAFPTLVSYLKALRPE